jgi:thiol:disulfide interchange protein
LQGKPLHFFPEIGSVIQTAATPKQGWSGSQFNLQVPLDPQRSASPADFALVLAPQVKGYETQALRVVAKLGGTWPGGVAATGVSPGLDAALKANASTTTAAPSLTFWAALMSALVGGLILNLMPCVFPVLALKVFGVVQHSAPRERRASALAYTAGVILSLLALASVLLALRAAGDAVGWGFQLQSPPVVAGLALLFTLLALNFSGLFEFGSMLPSRVASATAKNPVVDSFLGGVLAVGVASPCTAPFMGAALGFAVGLPAIQALAIFAALGLGLALPFLLIGLVPALAKWLPRPGAWMDTARKLMAFPMLATVVWLVWVLGQQTGINGAAALLLLLVCVAFVAWSFAQSGKAKWVFAAISIATTLAIAATTGSKVLEMTPEPGATAAKPGAADWQAWQPGKAEALLAQGQPVFVDFTAAWCVTCQFNKQNALADIALLADMDSKKVARLRADWTRRDPAITQALTQLGRSGVPVYVLYQPGQAPVVFGEVLSVNDVRQAVSKL